MSYRLLGRAGRDAELKFTASGKAICKVSLAENFGYGEKKRTVWHDVTFWDKAAEYASKDIKRGVEVYVEGELHQSSYVNKEGTKVTRTELNGRHYKVPNISKPKTTYPSNAEFNEQPNAPVNHDNTAQFAEEDIPF